MRTLDEEIAHQREVAEKIRTEHNCECDYYDIGIDCVKCAEEHEQLAEWLVELKVYMEAERTLDESYDNGYNKAIDDYMTKLCNHCMQQTNECCKLECPFCTDGCDIVNTAQQLKAGENNGDL